MKRHEGEVRMLRQIKWLARRIITSLVFTAAGTAYAHEERAAATSVILDRSTAIGAIEAQAGGEQVTQEDGAQSQTEAPASQISGDDIVVTGYRLSLRNSLNVKRLSDVQVDAITAEDIADFPDSNLAEVLAAASWCLHRSRQR